MIRKIGVLGISLLCLGAMVSCEKDFNDIGSTVVSNTKFETGEILLDELKTEIPDFRLKDTDEFASVLGDEVVEEFPWKETMEPSSSDNVEGVL